MEKLSNSIAENVKRIRWEIDEAAIAAGRRPEEVKLMAVTKTQPAALVNEAIAAGIHLLGENRAQELCQKYEEYHKEQADIHFIGHLQTNKVKQVVGKVKMVESVDSFKLAREISKFSQKLGVTTEVLVQVNIGGEETKAGIEPSQAEELIRQIATLPGIQVQGLMAIPPIWNSSRENEGYFARMHEILVDIKDKKIDNVNMEVLSMGMSGDFAVAIRHGSTLVRLGTAIFGSRNYT
ncbi:MAG: YggS family pyridoxal phosphate-dependent enzyme [Oscillospiraceae bacterium]|jgi:pyridoxal phosphate enzyme (YggS family)